MSNGAILNKYVLGEFYIPNLILFNHVYIFKYEIDKYMYICNGKQIHE